MAKLPHNNSLTATVGEFASLFANITSNSSYYDDYAYVHSDLNPTIHFTGILSHLPALKSSPIDLFPCQAYSFHSTDTSSGPTLNL